MELGQQQKEPIMFRKMFLHPLTYILIFAFVIQIAMINYGLPLWLYNDEPPFVLTSLKMMQLKTLLPVLHESDFKPFMYYPPYISYLYLPFFLITVLVTYISFSGSFSDYLNLVASDPSPFFITGRIVIILLSLFTTYLICRIVYNLTKERIPSIASSILTSTSLMFVTLSVTGKHWLPILFFYVLAFYFLTKLNWSLKKRILVSSLTTGIGIGVSTIVILFSAIIVLWYIFVEKKSLKNLFSDIYMYWSLIITLTLSFIPILLYPASLGFVPDTTLHDPKTFLGYLGAPFLFTKTFLFTEPVITILFLIGLFFGFKKYKSYCISFLIFIAFYSMIFYTFFRFEYRFLLPLLLPFILGASFGIQELKEKLPKKIFAGIISILLLVSTIFAVRLSVLGHRNDSRIQAREWLEENVEKGSKVIVYANLMRLHNTKEGILEQEFIDPNSLRTNDKSELKLDPKLRNDKVFHALNLYTVSNDNFYKMIVPYVKSKGYEYLVLSKKDFLDKEEQFKEVQKLKDNGKLIASFGNDVSTYSLGKTEIGPNLLPLFRIHEFGPEIEIYKLK
jgi:hypothetical protein